jgi:HEAT repeat protein
VLCGTLAHAVNERDARREQIREATRITSGGDELAIVGLLDSSEPAVRQHAAGAVRRKRLIGALPELRSRIECESDPEVRSSLALALAELAQPESRSVLHALLSDPQEVNRRMALRGLSFLGDESVTIPAVEAYTSATNRFGKQEALDALARLQTEVAHTELMKLLRTESSWRWRRRIRRAARRAPIRRQS